MQHTFIWEVYWKHTLSITYDHLRERAAGFRDVKYFVAASRVRMLRPAVSSWFYPVSELYLQDGALVYESMVMQSCDAVIEAVNKKREELLEEISHHKEMRIKALRDQVHQRVVHRAGGKLETVSFRASQYNSHLRPQMVDSHALN